jgi:putative flippase GtrA
MTAARYLLAGAVNTAVGFSVILVLQFRVGLDPRLANAVGVGVGLVVSFVLNRTFVFGRAVAAQTAAPKFAASVAIAFLASQAVLWSDRLAPGFGPMVAIAVQGVAVGAYSLTLFALCRCWVFAHKPVRKNVAG